MHVDPFTMPQLDFTKAQLSEAMFQLEWSRMYKTGAEYHWHKVVISLENKIKRIAAQDFRDAFMYKPTTFIQGKALYSIWLRHFKDTLAKA